MSKKYNIHPDFRMANYLPNLARPSMMGMFNRLYRFIFPMIKPPKGLQLSSEWIEGYGGEKIELIIFKPDKVKPNAPCILYCHGGGFFSESLPFQKKFCFDYALALNCIIVFVQYRVAVGHRFPTSIEDCYAELLWAYKNANTLGINQNKIAIMGDSAGGSHAAVVAQMAKDRGQVPLCFQMLIYPMADHQMQSKSMQEFTDTPVWDTVKTRYAWQLYLRGHDKTPTYASPMNYAHCAGLPPAYIETAEFDCLRDEGIAYAERLEKAGVSVILNQTKGTIHGYDVFPKSPITQENIAKRIRILKDVFHS